MIKVGDMVHFEATDVIWTVKYCNFSSCIMKLQYLKCILTRFFFQKYKLKKHSFHMRFTNPALSAYLGIIKGNSISTFLLFLGFEFDAYWVANRSSPLWTFIWSTPVILSKARWDDWKIQDCKTFDVECNGQDEHSKRKEVVRSRYSGTCRIDGSCWTLCLRS